MAALASGRLIADCLDQVVVLGERHLLGTTDR
jgi:hypothetical protein